MLLPLAENFCLLTTSCNKQKVQHISRYCGFPTIFYKSIYHQVSHSDSVSSILEIVFGLEMTKSSPLSSERKNKRECEHKMLTNSEEKVPRQWENETNENWDQGVREVICRWEEREYGMCFSYYFIVYD